VSVCGKIYGGKGWFWFWSNLGANLAVVCKRNRVDIFCRLRTINKRDRQTKRQFAYVLHSTVSRGKVIVIDLLTVSVWYIFMYNFWSIHFVLIKPKPLYLHKLETNLIKKLMRFTHSSDVTRKEKKWGESYPATVVVKLFGAVLALFIRTLRVRPVFTVSHRRHTLLLFVHSIHTTQIYTSRKLQWTVKCQSSMLHCIAGLVTSSTAPMSHAIQWHLSQWSYLPLFNIKLF